MLLMLSVWPASGKIEEGYDADLVHFRLELCVFNCYLLLRCTVLLTARPGDPNCKVTKTIIDGVVVWKEGKFFEAIYQLKMSLFFFQVIFRPTI